jgi:hypothetical protein
MKRSRRLLIIACVTALVAALGFGALLGAPEVVQAPVAQEAPQTTRPTQQQPQLPECPEALGANPMGGPCIPRALRNAPPDPGPENDKTLAGIDSNGNGVRDDVERYIVANYAESPAKVAFLLQYAREVLPFVSTTMNSPAVALAQSARLSRANACAARLIGPGDRAMTTAELRRFDEWLDAAKNVEIQHLNTTDRLAQFIKNEKLLAGHGLTLENWNSVQTACDFPAIDRSAQPQGEKQ